MKDEVTVLAFVVPLIPAFTSRVQPFVFWDLVCRQRHLSCLFDFEIAHRSEHLGGRYYLLAPFPGLFSAFSLSVSAHFGSLFAPIY